MTYSSVEDLLTGKIPLPGGVDAARYVESATDEVDTFIGFRYQTPVDVSDTSPVVRPARLLLKRIANMLAVSAGAEYQKQHAYGRSLVNEATGLLNQIAEGTIVLEGAESASGFTGNSTGPLIANEDAESNVSAFYNRVIHPNGYSEAESRPLPSWW